MNPVNNNYKTRTQMKRSTVILSMIGLLALSSLHVDAKQNDDTTLARTRQTQEVIVQASRVRSAATDQQLSARDLKLLPVSSSQDLLRVVPGLEIAQHAGGGKAEQIFLRGFDCDHGTDISISVDDSPVNMVSHGHGQGYADLHYVIPETIERIDVLKGPYYASAGDQATAGQVRIHTADTLSENILKAHYGMFESYRGLALLGTRIASTNIYGGAELQSTRGYFDAAQNFRRANAILKVLQPIDDRWTLKSSAFLFSSDWNASGQIPQRAVDAGLISHFGAIDSLEGGNTSRATLQWTLHSNGAAPWTINAGYTRYRFQLFSNFSFYAEDPVNGDMIEQTDERAIAHVSASTMRHFELGSIAFSLNAGASLRMDDIHTALYHSQKRSRLSTSIDANIRQADAALFAEQSVFIGQLTLNAALRAQYFRFAVEDLSNGNNKERQQVLFSPKLNAAYDLSSSCSVYFNSGFGFHTNDARAVVRDSSENVIPRAFGSEFGFRLHNESAALCAAAWMLDLESELVWSGDAGNTESSGRTRRIGIDLDLRCELMKNYSVGADLCVSRGRYRDEPEGQNFIALAPNLTLSAYSSYTGDIVSAAVRVRSISSRPANEDNSIRAEGYAIVDFNCSVSVLKGIDLTLECRNLLNTEWKEAQFDTTSRLQNEGSAVSDLHFSAGTPLSLKVGCQWSW